MTWDCNMEHYKDGDIGLKFGKSKPKFDKLQMIFRPLSNRQLDDTIKDLQHKLSLAQLVREQRGETTTQSWMCGLCGFENENSDVVFKHIRKEHGMCSEDANYYTTCIQK